MTMLAHKLTRLIETHADALVERLEKKIASSERCADYHNVSAVELKTLVGGIYGHLGEWLISKTEEDIERRYSMIGTRRAEENVHVSQLLWCITLVKENLWEFLQENEGIESTSQIFGELMLTQMVDQFFDRAMYYAVRAHEQVRDVRLTELQK